MEGVEILLKNGAVCDVPGMDYITPLHKACLNQNENIIKLLIAYGANVNITDSMGMRPLYNNTTYLPSNFNSLKIMIVAITLTTLI